MTNLRDGVATLIKQEMFKNRVYPEQNVPSLPLKSQRSFGHIDFIYLSQT